LVSYAGKGSNRFFGGQVDWRWCKLL
jgi:hypothetical protein